MFTCEAATAGRRLRLETEGGGSKRERFGWPLDHCSNVESVGVTFPRHALVAAGVTPFPLARSAPW